MPLEYLCQPGFRHLLVVVSFVSFPCEAVLADLMGDARLCIRWKEVRQAFESEVDWLSSLLPGVWAAFADFCGQRPMQLRSDILYRCHIAASFLHMRLFQPQQEYPCVCAMALWRTIWRACWPLKPLRANGIAQQIWRLHRGGWQGAPYHPKIARLPENIFKSIDAFPPRKFLKRYLLFCIKGPLTDKVFTSHPCKYIPYQQVSASGCWQTRFC